MKRFFLFSLCLLMFGCASAPMRFQLPPGTTQDEFMQARKECGDSGSGGYFLFGPLILLAPVFAMIEGVKYSNKVDVQDCMESKGFKCIENCAKESSIGPRRDVMQEQRKVYFPTKDESGI